MNDAYRKHLQQRLKRDIPPEPLTVEQTRDLVADLLKCEEGQAEELLALFTSRVPPGVDAASEVKARFLADVAWRKVQCDHIGPTRAVELLGTMLGGYNVPYLIRALDSVELGPTAEAALRHTTLVFDLFGDVWDMAGRGNRMARRVVESWADAEWFTSLPPFPETLQVTVFRVDGEVNTDDLSPASEASTRPDIPLHALSMGQTRFPGGIETIRALRDKGETVAFVSHTLGTGSSRKSATNSMLWHLGEDIPYVPNIRRRGVMLAESIAPIFFNTVEDSGGLPIRVDSIERLVSGAQIVISLHQGTVEDEAGNPLAQFELSPDTLKDEYRAGGRIPLLIGRRLTAEARAALQQGGSSVFVLPATAAAENVDSQAYSLAQKLVGRACDTEGILPGQTCEPRTVTVGSQDTTGPMTRDELKALACLSFQADLVMQSFCHTAAYPKERDRVMHHELPRFINARGGVSLRPGDGIIHSWLNRLLVPDTVGTGGDSHTRFPLGISFPAGSGLVAFAAALGRMPLDMPESVLVRFNGEFQQGITLRDVVNFIPLRAVELGLSSPYGEGTENVFNSRIMEMAGLPDLAVEQAFELTCASAERSAAAATIALGVESVRTYCESNVQLMKQLVEQGYNDSETLQNRIQAVEAWLEAPSLLQADAEAPYAARLDLDISSIREPVVALPHNPDHVKHLSDVAGTEVDEVFIGSCMTNIGHFRAAARILARSSCKVKRLWLTPPTRLDRDQLAREGVDQVFKEAGARVEIPGCSLCMGNQARVEDKAVVFSTSTRNFADRMGAEAEAYLGSAELAAVVATLGRIPTPEEYLEAYQEAILPHQEEIYQYLDLRSEVE